MKLRQVIFQQAIFVCFCMTCVLSAEEIIAYFTQGAFFELSGYMPLSFVLISFFTAIPSIIFYNRSEVSIIRLRLRIFLHYLCLAFIVLGSGYLFKWYHEIKGFLIMVVSFTVIYVLVWVVTRLIFHNDAKKINAVLEKIRDDE